MKRLVIPVGKINLEVYRLLTLTKAHVRAKLKKHTELARVVAISAFLVLIPSLEIQAEEERFPDTRRRLVYSQSAYPVSAINTKVNIEPGESYAQQKEREVKNVSRQRRGMLTVSLRSANYPPCPESFRPFYQEVGPRFGVPWQVIEAIHQVESGKSCHTNRRSHAGATGPMQFLPSTWRIYQWDCTGDGVADITNAYDAICTGAHYIGTGLTGFSLERSIYSYNRSWSYVGKVMSIAREIGLEG